jgi:exopolyphosphatase / guanosine-5'-triphosphate,3'-diphosphate pyrophosphatase
VTRVAAVDVGTNSVRLLIAEEGDGGAEPLRTLERQMRITRLGQGVDATGHLHDDALARTLSTLEDYAGRWRALGVDRVRVAATSAVRDAADRARFFDGVVARTGAAAEVLSGEEEGRIAFLGATATVTGQPPIVVLDIGGGSTELIRGTTTVEAMSSRQLGCVRLTERALHTDPPTAAELGAARGLVDSELDAVEELVDPAAARTLVGVAGTITTIAALYLELPAYEPARIHGTRVPAADVAAITGRLCGMTVAQRRGLGPMAPGREDVIHAGAIILERVVQRFGFADVLVSETDILDGLAIELLDGRAVSSRSTTP